MKIRASISGILLCVVAHAGIADVVRLSEPVASNGVSETFGQQFDASLPTLSLSELMARPAEHLGQNLLVKTKVGKVCQKKGCFFLAVDGALAVRVSFRDYGFFVPTDSGGKTVMLAGELIQRQRSSAQARHFNEDMEDREDTLASGMVYEIVADAVRVPK